LRAKLDSNGAVAACHESGTRCGQDTTETIHPKSARRGGLNNHTWIATVYERHHGVAPTPVVRQFHHRRREFISLAHMLGEQTCATKGLDITAEKNSTTLWLRVWQHVGRIHTRWHRCGRSFIR